MTKDDKTDWRSGRRKNIEKGTVFDRLTVLETIFGYRKQTQCRCQCECGKETLVDAVKLRNGHTRSCGCLHGEALADKSRTHGMTGTKIYLLYRTMLNRCYNPKVPCYPSYGGRGIQVCDRWRNSFENFVADMGPCPAGMTLDRIDNSKGYGVDNCRWTTRKEQARNTRRNRLITLEGRTQCVAAWAEERRLDPNVVHRRLALGWSEKEAVLTD